MAGTHGFMIFLDLRSKIIPFAVTEGEFPAKIELPSEHGMPPHGFFVFVQDPWGCYLNMGVTWARAQGQIDYQCRQETKNVFHSGWHKLVVVLEDFGIPMTVACFPRGTVAKSECSVADDLLLSRGTVATSECFMWFPDRDVPVESVTVVAGQILFKNKTSSPPVHGFGEKVEVDGKTFWIIQFHHGGKDEKGTVHVFEKSVIEAGDIYVPVTTESLVQKLRDRTSGKAKNGLNRYNPYGSSRPLMIKR